MQPSRRLPRETNRCSVLCTLRSRDILSEPASVTMLLEWDVFDTLITCVIKLQPCIYSKMLSRWMILFPSALPLHPSLSRLVSGFLTDRF